VKEYNKAFLKIAKRAERQDDDILQKTFVDIGSVFDVLSSIDHQIIYGRRGTGKTHILTVLRKEKEENKEVAIQLDMRNLGSVGGVYADATLPIKQRATRLLVDVLASIHSSILEFAIDKDDLIDLSLVGPALDAFFDAHSEVTVSGAVTHELIETNASSTADKMSAGINIDLKGAGLNAGFNKDNGQNSTVSVKTTTVGVHTPRVNFGRVGTAMKKMVENLPNKKLWLLIDEWSEVPLDLQPILADLLRRAVLPIRGVVVKIAAIEQRSNFIIPDQSVGNIGIEVGADISSAVTLDDYMVFDNDEDKAVDFFKRMILKHIQAVWGDDRPKPASTSELISKAFTQSNAFIELVRACEGVPRDIIHILSLAAQKANEDAVSIPHVRQAAAAWYLSSKESVVSSHALAKNLLFWIVDSVIKTRRTKAFLLKVGTSDELIDYLYDARVLHILRKGISAQDLPGIRYSVYGIDYGCYVDLINTQQSPLGMLDIGDESVDVTGIVPKTDLRSARRCILELNEFYQHH
jgi:hypothetical protein